jgi:hypothetical protein
VYPVAPATNASTCSPLIGGPLAALFSRNTPDLRHFARGAVSARWGLLGV